MRELLTIGDVHAARPAARSRARRRQSMGFVEMGVTNPGFAAPTEAQVNAASPGTALINAAQALAAYLATSGVPSMHVDDPFVHNFQTEWNGDPVSEINGASSKLSEDGGYGVNTQAALASFGAYSAPAVNAGTVPVAPAPIPGVVTPPAVVPTPGKVVPAAAGSSDVLPVLLIVGALGVGAWLLFFRKKKRARARASSSKAMVLVKSNPRRRRRRNSGDLFA